MKRCGLRLRRRCHTLVTSVNHVDFEFSVKNITVVVSHFVCLALRHNNQASELIFRLGLCLVLVNIHIWK